ncbi:MAG: iron chelate uptake ABC transporter family permease subunit [Caldisericia bacterium]
MRNNYIFLLLGICLFVTIGLGVVIGTSSVGIGDSIKAFFAGIGIGKAPAGDIAIVHAIRIPGILVATLAGSALGAAGWLSQTLFRNDLADPYIAGIGSGAIFGVNITLLLGLELGLLGMSAVSVSAFIGSLLACLLIWIIAGRTGSTGVSLVLAGVALSFVLSGNYLIVM